MQSNWVVPQREQHPLSSEMGEGPIVGKKAREFLIGCDKPKENKAR